MPVRFIAELGQNHGGSLQVGKQMVDELEHSGCYAIKTAKRNVELHREEWSKIENYRDGMNYYEHRKDLELTDEEFIELKEYVNSKGILFMSSFTDLDSLEFLCEIDVQGLKIASSRNIDQDLINSDYLVNRLVVISDGMTPDDRVLRMARDRAWICLSCTSAYPTDIYSIPGRGIQEYDGFSAHWHSSNRLYDYALFGAIRSTKDVVYIERHVTLDKEQNGIDHYISLDCDEVEWYIDRMKELDHIMQTPKQIFKDELPAIKKLRHDLI